MRVELLGYSITAMQNGKRKPLPKAFLDFIEQRKFANRWDRKPTSEIHARNVHLPGFFEADTTVWGATLIEASTPSEIALINLASGDDAGLKVPDGHGERRRIRMAIDRKNCLLVMELAGKGVHHKLSMYLDAMAKKWHGAGGQEIEGILIGALPVEEEPTTILRKNGALKSFEASLNAASVDGTKYGVLGSWVGNLVKGREDLVVRIEIRQRTRGAALPKVVVDSLAEFLGHVDDYGIEEAKTQKQGEQKATSLLSAIAREVVDADDDDDAVYDQILNVVHTWRERFSQTLENEVDD